MKTIAITSPAIQPEVLLRSALDRIRYLESELQKLHNSISTPIGNIRIRQANRVITSSAKEIVYVQSENNYSRLFMKDGSQYYTSRTLKSWAKELSTSDFLRCHRTYLVNRTAVMEINRLKNVILLQGGVIVPTSRRFQKSCLSVISPKELAIDNLPSNNQPLVFTLQKSAVSSPQSKKFNPKSIC